MLTMSASQTGIPVYDCLVLSGGGAKGAYGAGAAKALYAYRHFKKVENPICFIGASAGGLNAAVLATQTADDLVRFWLGATNKTVLGVRIKNVKWRSTIGWCKQWWREEPFSIYPNAALKRMIGSSVRLVEQPSRHLIVAATDLTQAALKTFYASTLIEKLVEKDLPAATRGRRIADWLKIDTNDGLVSVLLASSAIPVFFPPVKIETPVTTDKGSVLQPHWYVDGGVGNHTPTREAMYFLRHLKRSGLGRVGDVYCIKQDPQRVVDDNESRFGFSDMFKRTLEVYHHIHMEPIIRALSRINYEVREQQERLDRFKQWLGTQGLPPPLAGAILKEVADDLGKLGGETERIDVSLIVVGPGATLGDSLDFDPKRIKAMIAQGYNDMIEAIAKHKKIDELEKGTLLQQPIFA